MMAKISATDAALLGLLTHGEQSGYDLLRVPETSGAFFWAPTKSRIYAVLPQLVERGYATSRKVVQSGRPNKRLYRITKPGRAALQSWLEEPPSFEPERAPVLLKLYLGELLEPTILIEHLRKVRDEAAALERKLEAQPPADNVYAEITVLHGLEWSRAMTRWATGAEQEIASRIAAP
jgi:DNA-binding PadR family transcriptional regulator